MSKPPKTNNSDKQKRKTIKLPFYNMYLNKFILVTRWTVLCSGTVLIIMMNQEVRELSVILLQLTIFY